MAVLPVLCRLLHLTTVVEDIALYERPATERFSADSLSSSEARVDLF
jgi:hypothetical protein